MALVIDSKCLDKVGPLRLDLALELPIIIRVVQIVLRIVHSALQKCRLFQSLQLSKILLICEIRDLPLMGCVLQLVVSIETGLDRGSCLHQTSWLIIIVLHIHLALLVKMSGHSQTKTIIWGQNS